MDIQKILSYGSAAAVVGTGAVVGGGAVVDNLTDGPAKRQELQLQQIKELAEYKEEQMEIFSTFVRLGILIWS